MSSIDLRLAGRLLSGDERAFDEFFRDNFPRLYRFALARMAQDADGAEEVAQATLCRAIVKLGTYRGEAALFTWLCTFCRHEISAYYRRAQREPARLGLVEADEEVTAALESLSVATGEGPEEALERSEVASFVHSTLDLLPGRYADALEWKYIDGFSVAEIALRLQVTPKAAESLLTRARDAFRDGFSTLVRHRRGAALPETS